MVTVSGTADHCQLTSRLLIGRNGAGTTTCIALFRLGGQQVQFSSRSPLSISGGDHVVVAGYSWRGLLNADAVRNVTTGLTRQTGIAGRILMAVFLPLVGTVLALLAYHFTGMYGGWIVFGGFIAGSLLMLWRAVQIVRAWSFVRSTVP